MAHRLTSLYNVFAARVAAAVALALVASLHPTAQAPEALSPCELTAADRIVAIGDVHGAYEPFLAILREAGLIDKNRHWTGGKATFVQTGDVLDRGPDSKRVLDLLRNLEGEAAKAGGQVLALVGNHEVMRMVGDMRYISAKEYSAFASPDARDLREGLYKSAVDSAKADAKTAGQRFDESAFSKLFYAQTPLGLVEMQRAFAKDGDHGKRLRTKPLFIRLNGIVFVHGGFTPPIAEVGCVPLTTRARLELQAAAIGMAPKLELLSREDGPLWYRGLADDTATEARVTAALAGLGAKAIVMGHTPTTDNKIQMQFGGRAITIDTGMLNGEFYPNGVPSALEIKDGIASAIYIGRREPLGPIGK